jgi:hypothetical protein
LPSIQKESPIHFIYSWFLFSVVDRVSPFFIPIGISNELLGRIWNLVDSPPTPKVMETKILVIQKVLAIDHC